MKKFILKTGLFSFLLLVLLYALDTTVSYGLRKSTAQTYNNLTQIFHGSINADLVINGSSKALVHFSPKILDSMLHLNSYNLAMDGTEFLIQKTQYDLYEKYNMKPKILIQTVGNGTLILNPEIRNQIQFAPYLNEPKVTNLVRRYGGFDFWDINFPMVKYSGEYEQVANGLFCAANVQLKETKLYKGYLERDDEWDGTFEAFKKVNPNGIEYEYDTYSKELFAGYLAEMKAKGITVFLIYPPTYYEFHPYMKNKKEIIQYYQETADKLDIPFYDYSNCSLSQDRKYFYNSQHLNKTGAEIFSRMVARDIAAYQLTEQ